MTIENAELKVPTFEQIKNQKEFDAIELDVIAEEAKKDISDSKKSKRNEVDEEKEEKVEKKSEESTGKKEKAEDKEEEGKEEDKKDELSEEEKEKDAEKKKKEEERLLNSKDEDLKDGEKYQKLQIVKAREEERLKKEADEIKAFSERKKLSLEQAKEELEHIKKISAKYKDNPREIAEAYLAINRDYTRKSQELKTIQEASPIRQIEKLTEDDIIRDVIDTGRITVKGKPGNREEIVKQYRLTYQRKTEAVDDDTVLLMVASDIKSGLIAQRTQQLAEQKVKAKDKRIEMLNSLGDGDKEFGEVIKSVVENYSDEAILSESFSVNDVIRWAKGEKYDDLKKSHTEDVKKAYDDGYRKGKEEAKILGVKAESTSKETGKSSKKVTLNEAQKKEALNMFDHDGMTDEEKYEAYFEVLKSRKERK